MGPVDLLCSRNARSRTPLSPRWTRAEGDHLARPQGRKQKIGEHSGEKRLPTFLFVRVETHTIVRPDIGRGSSLSVMIEKDPA